jgi:hypothetical protein
VKFFLLLILATIISLPGLCQEEDDELLRALEQRRLMQVERAQELNKLKAGLEDKSLGLVQEFKKIGDNPIFDDQFHRTIQEVLSNNPLARASAEEVRKLVLQSVEGRPLEKLFHHSPRLLELSVDWLRDREAMPALAGLLGRKEDLKKYFYFWLALIITTFLFKRYFFSKEWNFFRRMFMSLLVSLLSISLSVGVFYYVFTSEIAPTFKVISKHL